MATTNKKPVTKNSVIANTIESSVYNLELALDKANMAVTARSAESKKLLNETRRLRKRCATQMGKKKRAIAADKKNSTVDSRKAVRTVTAELNTTSKALVKATASRQAVLEELSGLKQSQKMLSGYVKGIYAADRAIARSKKKKRAKRVS
jgi:hypothetical protein